MLLGEPPRTPYDLNFPLLGIPVRVSPWFWLIAADVGLPNGRTPGPVSPGLSPCFSRFSFTNWGMPWLMRAYGFRRGSCYTAMGGLACYDPRYAPRSKGSDTLGQVLISAAGPAAGFLLAGLLVLAFVAGRLRPCAHHRRLARFLHHCVAAQPVAASTSLTCTSSSSTSASDLGLGQSLARLSVGRRANRARAVSEVHSRRRHSPVVVAVDVRRRRGGGVRMRQMARYIRRVVLRLSGLLQLRHAASLQRSPAVVKHFFRLGLARIRRKGKTYLHRARC